MPTILMTLLAFTSITALSMITEAQQISRAAPAGKHPYDVALEYCAERGGLAQYSVKGDIVRFSCSDDLSSMITLSS
nr:hypothetical protein [uncultured Halomonas sp.]